MNISGDSLMLVDVIRWLTYSPSGDKIAMATRARLTVTSLLMILTFAHAVLACK